MGLRGGGHGVGGQFEFAVRARPGDDGRGGRPGMGQQHRLDLRRFDPYAMDLDLVVRPAQELQGAVGPPPHQVTGAVPASAGHGRVRVGREAFGGLPGAAQIPASKSDAADAELTWDADRDQEVSRVHHGHPHAGQGAADGDRAGAGQADARVAVGRRVDGALGGAVGVGDLHPGHGGAQLLAQICGQRLARGTDQSQCGAVGQGRFLDQEPQHRGHQLQQRDPVAGHGGGHHRRVTVRVGGGRHHGAAGDQRREELPHGGVEPDGGLLQQPVGGGHRVALHRPQHPVAQPAVRDHHALGSAGGARGVDQADRVVRAGRVGDDTGRRGGGSPGRTRPLAFPREQHGGPREAIAQGLLGEHEARRGVRQQEVPPGVREVGGQRYVDATDGQDRQHRGHQRRAPVEADRDRVARAYPGVTQTPGQNRHLLDQFGVGLFAGVVGDGHRPGSACRAVQHQLDQTAARAVLPGGAGPAVAPGGERGALPVGGRLQPVHRCVRAGDHLVEKVQEVLRHPLDPVPVEQRRGVDELTRDAAVGTLGQVQGEVERGAARAGVGPADLQARERERDAVRVVQREAGLEDRVAVGLPLRGQGGDHPFEGHLLVAVGVQGRVPHPGQQPTEVRRPVQLGAQHHGVEEHADQLLQPGVVPVGQGDADRDVWPARIPGEQQLIGGQPGHEECGALLLGERGEAGCQRAGHGEADGVPGRVPHRRTRPVGGKFQRRGARQLFPPVVELPPHPLRLCPPPLALPLRVVRVLELQRLQRRDVPGRERPVQHSQFVGEQTPGPAVEGDVVEGEQQSRLLRCQPDHRDPPGVVPAQIDRGTGAGRPHRAQALFPPVVGDAAEVGELGFHRLRFVDDLDGGAVLVDVPGAQHFVPGGYLGECGGQGLGVQRAPDPEGLVHQVLGGVTRPELVEQPQLFLCEGQRITAVDGCHRSCLPGRVVVRAGAGGGRRRVYESGRGRSADRCRRRGAGAVSPARPVRWRAQPSRRRSSGGR